MSIDVRGLPRSERGPQVMSALETVKTGDSVIRHQISQHWRRTYPQWSSAPSVLYYWMTQSQLPTFVRRQS